MFHLSKALTLSTAIVMILGDQSLARGGGGAGHSSVGGGFSGHSMSMGSFHGSSFSSGSHFSMGSPHMGFQHSSAPTTGELGHIRGMHSNPMWSPYFSSGESLHTQPSHGFAHGLARFFGLRPSNPQINPSDPAELPASNLSVQTKSANNTLASNLTSGLLQNTRLPANLNPFFGHYNPYLNNCWGNRFYHRRFWNPYFNNTWAYPYFSPWFFPGYFNPYLYPFYYSSLYPLSFPYGTFFSYQSSLDPYFVSSDIYNTGFDPNYYADPNYSSSNSFNDDWTPPKYDPSSGIVDPDLVPFDMGAPPVPPASSSSGANNGYDLPQQPSGWTP
jgi:hypothetical protein